MQGEYTFIVQRVLEFVPEQMHINVISAEMNLYVTVDLIDNHYPMILIHRGLAATSS